jgi:ribose-phosphate pyrophosphokinase
MKLIAGSSNIPLASSIAQSLGLPLMDVEISHFPNGEKRVWIKEEILGENVILVQSFSEPTDQHIMEFLLLTDALERLGVRHINLVLPWMGYSLQDKVFRPGEPIAAKVVANLVSTSYVKRVFLLDLHNSSTPGFFSIPAHHLTAQNLFIKHIRQNFDLSQTVIASPDFGGLKRARTLAEKLGVELVNIDKHRNLHTGVATAMGLNGEVAGKTVIMYDDVINSGSTIVAGSQLLKEQGAEKVIFVTTHGPLVPAGYHNLQLAPVDEVLVTNSIFHPQTLPKLTVLDVGSTFADALKPWLQPS